MVKRNFNGSQINQSVTIAEQAGAAIDDVRNLILKYDENGDVILVVFRNGYSKDSPEVVCKCTLQFGKGKPEWGAEPGKLYYVLKIEKVEEVRNHVLLG